MNLQFSEEEIKVLFTDFQAIKRYADKIHFFDLHFNVVPFDFPLFETDIYKFFSASNVLKLAEILKIEQKTPALLDRIFHFQSSSYTFSIRPNNSNNIALNNYILSKFFNKNDQLDMLVIKQQRTHKKNTKSSDDLLNEASQMIQYLRKRIDSEYGSKASVETKLMAVFMKGYTDCLQGVRRPVFERRRKFIELYLYAYGYLYAKYMGFLSSGATDQSLQYNSKVELDKKIALLEEFGLLAAIRKKYYSLNRDELQQKTAEIVCLITGETTAKLSSKIEKLFI